MKLAQILAHKGDFVATVTPDATVADLLTLLSRFGVGALVVSPDGRHIEGIVSERDVVRALADRPDVAAEPVAGIMTSDVRSATADDTVEDMMALMTEHRIRHVPVVDEDGLLVGIVSIGDVVKNRLGELEGEREALVGYITRGG